MEHNHDCHWKATEKQPLKRQKKLALSPARGAVTQESIVNRAELHGTCACLLDAVLGVAQLSMRKRVCHLLGQIVAAYMQ